MPRTGRRSRPGLELEIRFERRPDRGGFPGVAHAIWTSVGDPRWQGRGCPLRRRRRVLLDPVWTAEAWARRDRVGLARSDLTTAGCGGWVSKSSPSRTG